MFNDNKAKVEGSNQDKTAEAAALEATRTIQGATVASTALDNAAKNGLNVFKTAGDLLGSIGEELNNIFSIEKNWERLKLLDKQSAEINEALGLGTKKAGEFKQLLADSFPRFAELGLDISEVQKQYVELSSAFGTNISITDEKMAEIAATSKVTGVEAGTLASAFRGVGVNLTNVADRMMDVTKVAKESGGIVRDVSDKVVKNLGQMNMYNFDGGIKGLAKMSTQASKLGIDMGKIFEITEKVFNPEGAIEMAASLQRLGVQTSALTDPLKLMDLSANDPAELQNQIVKMSKDFVSFNKNLGEFQIMPGEKRRLREVAEALNMSSAELSKMSLNAANLDYKMKQIKFAPGTSKEDREMIATLAQINKEGKAEVKVKQIGADGKETGEYEMVEVGKLTTDQLKLLKESQELQGKSMEELAIDQLSELGSLNAKMSSFLTSIRFAFPSSKTGQELYGAATTGARKSLFKEFDGSGPGIVNKEIRETENTRDFVNNTTKAMGDIFTEIKNKVTSVKSVDDVTKLFGDAADFLTGKFDELKNKDVLTMFNDFTAGKNINPLNTATPSVSNALNTLNTSSTNSTVSTNNTVNNNSTIATPSKIENKPLEAKIDATHKIDINVNMDPNIRNQALSTFLSKALDEYYGSSTPNMAKLVGLIDKYYTENGLVPGGKKEPPPR
jgi:hypothetical protein